MAQTGEPLEARPRSLRRRAPVNEHLVRGRAPDETLDPREDDGGISVVGVTRSKAEAARERVEVPASRGSAFLLQRSCVTE